MISYASGKGARVSIGTGANLNHASEEALEALVRYRARRVRCSVDGATQETYRKYRVGGDFRNVLQSIQTLNRLKRQYASAEPELIFQFVVFEHNYHEIEAAAALAQLLEMELFLRLDSGAGLKSVAARDKLRRILGWADMAEYEKATGRHYRHRVCSQLWRGPQIDWDGSILGCSCNNLGTFPGNAFEEETLNWLNSEAMVYARLMLTGRRPGRDDIPCTRCEVFESRCRLGYWISEEEVLRSGAGRD
jgi:MoaA/NifB/PqqE/SkfB family radical SAM enzyme